MYVYIQSEHDLWAVGFYKPDGKWEPESDHENPKDAAERTAWLNGSRPTLPNSIQEAFNSGDGVYRP